MAPNTSPIPAAVKSSPDEQIVTNSRTIVNRHLSNKNDTISEEDIRSVDPNIRPKRDNGEDHDDPEELKNRKNDFDEAKQVPTAWNIND